jgi:hypothetical protein
MKKLSLGAVVAAGLLAGGMATSASAADFGGNCCADLEERIAELEATTARKGNRKVSLTISGWVAEQVTYWDDGVEDNVYVHGLGTTLATNVKFSGQATIAPGWSAGYLLHLEAIDSDGLTHNANTDVGPAVDPLVQQGDISSGIVTVLQSYWFIKSDQLGKVSVGRVSQASDNTAILVDGSGSLVAANWVAFDSNNFLINNNGGVGIAWGGAQSCRGMGGAWGDCNGLVRQGVRYDSPTFAGFSVSAGWGSDDFWDVAARYAGEFGGIKIAAAVAYNEWTGGPTPLLAAANFPGKMDYLQAGLYLQHVPTGLFILGNYGKLDDDFTGLPEADTYYVKAGLRQRWTQLGHTVLYGEWLQGDDGGATIGTIATNSELTVWGLGVVQEVDAAAMSVWLKYRNLEYEDNSGVSYQDADYIGLGGLINF